MTPWNAWTNSRDDAVPVDGQRVWVAKDGTEYRGIARFDMFGARFFVGENDVTKDVTHWAPCEPPEGP